jgi:hypothetical protein
MPVELEIVQQEHEGQWYPLVRKHRLASGNRNRISRTSNNRVSGRTRA